MTTYSTLHCASCSSPGACCRSIWRMSGADPSWPLTETGACTMLTDAGTCRIYADRPRVCRVDALRPPSFTVEEWYARNAEACAVLVAL